MITLKHEEFYPSGYLLIQRLNGFNVNASHNSMLCERGEDCICLVRVNEDNILEILNHELLHHAIRVLHGEWINSGEINRGLDLLADNWGDWFMSPTSLGWDLI